MARGQAERLFPLLTELLAEAGLGWSDLDAIGVGVGPGNFTGVRISVAAARGLALSLGIPAVGITVTEASACDAPRPCRAVVTLRGDEIAWQDFPASPPDSSLGSATGTPAPAALGRNDTIPNGPEACRSPHPLPVAIAILAARLVAASAAEPVGAPADRAAIARPAPLYLRPADAAPPRDPPPLILP